MKPEYKIPTAEEICKKHFDAECKAGLYLTPEEEIKVYKAMKEFAKLHVKAALKQLLKRLE